MVIGDIWIIWNKENVTILLLLQTLSYFVTLGRSHVHECKINIMPFT